MSDSRIPYAYEWANCRECDQYYETIGGEPDEILNGCELRYDCVYEDSDEYIDYAAGKIMDYLHDHKDALHKVNEKFAIYDAKKGDKDFEYYFVDKLANSLADGNLVIKIRDYINEEL